MGATEHHVPAGGAEPGDTILLIGSAGLEATAIVATDFADSLRSAGIEHGVLDRGAACISEISIIDAALAISHLVSGMHDPTEGGILTGCIEMATAAGCQFSINREAVPIREETQAVCEVFDVDPLRIFGSGALLATVPDANLDAVMTILSDSAKAVTRIGSVTAGEVGIVLDDHVMTEAPRDDLYHLWE